MIYSYSERGASESRAAGSLACHVCVRARVCNVRVRHACCRSAKVLFFGPYLWRLAPRAGHMQAVSQDKLGRLVGSRAGFWWILATVVDHYNTRSRPAPLRLTKDAWP